MEKRPLFVLILLLVLHVLLLSVQVRSQEGHTLVRSYGLWLVTPIASGLSFVAQQVEGVVDRYIYLVRSATENEQLRRENAQLKLRLAELNEYRSLQERLPGLERALSRFQLQAELASVILKNAPFQAHRIVIDAGRNRGLRRDTAVITAEGVVGRVLTTTPMSAEVELLTNSGAAAGALIGESRLQGIIQGRGTSLLHLEFVPNYENVEPGMTVYTSGTDRIYPKGLPIGRVVKSERGSMIYREIEVQPFVDYSRLEEVLFVQSG